MNDQKHSICYMILPEGIREDLDEGLKALSEKHAVSIVVIPGVNWNDDLTPWPAEGVFKKAKPFGGQASSFLDKLTREIIPETENFWVWSMLKGPSLAFRCRVSLRCGRLSIPMHLPISSASQDRFGMTALLIG